MPRWPVTRGREGRKETQEKPHTVPLQVEMMSQLQHPNVLNFYEHAEDVDNHYVVSMTSTLTNAPDPI